MSGDVTGGVMIVPPDPTLRSVLAHALVGALQTPAPGDTVALCAGDPDAAEFWAHPMARAMLQDPALAAAERVLTAAVAWERGRLDDQDAFVGLVEAIAAYRSAVEAR